MLANLILDDDPTVISAPSRAARVAHAQFVGNNALAPGTRLREFEIEGLIAEGGFGIVYVAYDHSRNRKVALKEYMPSALATRIGRHTVAPKSQGHSETFDAGLSSFINEAHLLKLFDHPSLVKVDRFWAANGTAYMVMPLYEGVTLKDALLSARKPPDEKWLKTLIVRLLDALRLLHAANCYHRDIAPDNILILRDGRPVLLDFGAARQVIGDMTQALTVILKPGYAPIEQYAETSSLTQGPWTDLYALAAVVHFAITGSPPTQSVARTVADPYEPLAQRARGRYSATFLSAIDRALALLPAARPQTVAEFAQLLGLELAADSPRGQSRAQSAPASDDRRKPAGKLTVAFGVGSVAVALAIGGGYALKKNQAPSSAPANSAQGFLTMQEPARPPDVPPLQRPPAVQTRTSASDAPRSESSAVPPAVVPPKAVPSPDTSRSAPQPPPLTRPTPMPRTPKEKPVQHRDAPKRTTPIAPGDKPSSNAPPSRGVPNESPTPIDRVTTSECGDILHRVSLGAMTAADQQLMREKCR
jgi:serine/threonine protein kinase